MCSSRQHGLSLIETVIFIVVLGIGIAGLAVLYNQVTRASVDPLVRKQAVAIATSLMEEIQLRPFTFCDPDDPLVFTETSPLGCSSAAQRESGTIGPEAGETRYADPRFDNVSDYHGFSMSGSIQDITNTPITGLTGYSAQVQIVAAGGDFPAAIPADEALRITVTVTGPATTQVVLQGYRLRYAPNSP
ncbi:MAG: prepilin-type N-terminal cleavage/methylation domain-containing protein [Burkholderiales bacterium]